MTDYPELKLYIDGEWLDTGMRESQPVTNPANGAVLGQVPFANADDLDRAIAASRAGFLQWRAVSAYDRARLIRRAAQFIRERAERIALLITLEQGKPLSESRQEVSNTADMFEWFADEGRRAYGRIIPAREPNRQWHVVSEPVGPVAAFAAWNVPAQTMSRKVGAALAAGCSVIYKPSEETPSTPLAIAAIFEEAGLPKGVLQVVTGNPDAISRHLLASPVIRKVTFTGSTAVGKHLARLAADNLQRLTMELGGHAPVIIFDDVDAEDVARSAAIAKYRNAGQICTSPTRFLVQEKIYDRFVATFAETARALKVDDGRADGAQMGPTANPRRVEAMER
ncbi:MAG: aldehyde dehydrogenase family protein, partial [Caulobacterales bacterium]